jgi:hypothetical protein
VIDIVDAIRQSEYEEEEPVSPAPNRSGHGRPSQSRWQRGQ